ncbi:MAG TPA: Spy/CpxP family protein refolding chaperone [Steroidobacteraceae bacterium]|nr:Spy/CpxP family protein refolding chaperone [Steroidobacteraceae bacterium]
MKLSRKTGLLLLAAASLGAGAVVAAAATTTAADATTTTSASTGRHWRHRHGGMLVGTLLRAAHQLNLTADQQTQIKGILSAVRNQHASTPAADMTVLGNPGDPNYAAALEVARSQASSRLQREIELQGQIYNVLTPEQKTKLPQVLAAMKTKAEQRRATWLQQHAAGTTGALGSN